MRPAVLAGHLPKHLRVRVRASWLRTFTRPCGGNGSPIGDMAIGMDVDVTSRASTVALAARAAEWMGGIDVLVNNAAIYAGLERKSFEAIDEQVWDRVMAVNVKGPWLMTSAVASHFRAANGGAVITCPPPRS